MNVDMTHPILNVQSLGSIRVPFYRHICIENIYIYIYHYTCTVFKSPKVKQLFGRLKLTLYALFFHYNREFKDMSDVRTVKPVC